MFKWLKELIWKLRGGLDGEFKRGHKDADKAWRKATKKST